MHRSPGPKYSYKASLDVYKHAIGVSEKFHKISL